MFEKWYKITTSKKVFETGNIGPDYLKTDNDVFYARENTTEEWQQVKKIEKRCYFVSFMLSFLFYILGFVLIFVQKHIDKIDGWLGAWFYFGLFLSGLIFAYTEKFLSFYTCLSYKNISEIINNNKLHSTMIRSSYRNYSARSSYSSSRSSGTGGGSYSGGSSGGGYSGYSSNYISSSDLDKALKNIESKGKSWEDLANSTTDEEREKLFADYFKDKEKGEVANDKFNREQLGPARKRTLDTIFAEAEYEDDEVKENLKEKINNFDNTISNDEFQITVKEIRKFQERKKFKDNHIKYEGRLSNKDIKTIKDVLGYVCMGCGLDPVKEYGAEMKGILEAHHKTPWAEIKENEVRTVEPNDFYILCPTCHRIIHKLERSDDLDKLKELVNKKKSSWWD